MPAVVKCAICGHVLLIEARDLKHNRGHFGAETWFDRLHRQLKGKCPGCKRKLPEPNDFGEQMKVTVTPLARKCKT